MKTQEFNINIILLLIGLLIGALLHYGANIYFTENKFQNTEAFYYKGNICYQANVIAEQFEYKSYHEICHYSVQNNKEHFFRS